MANPFTSSEALDPSRENGPNLAPGWIAETVAIWTQFPARKGILDLTRRQLTHLPEEIFRMRKLEKLILSHNEITIIPSGLARLAEAGLMRTIECEHNLLEAIDEEVAQLQSLEQLKLAHNRMQTFPPIISQLYQLVELDLSYNEIADVPGSLGNLLFLETLNLSHNQLYHLPQTLMNLARLVDLDLSHNQLTELPPGIANLSRLARLCLQHNLFEELPLEMGFLLGVEEWHIEDNPYSRMQVIHEQQLYKRPILNYLRSELRADPHYRLLLFSEKDSRYNNFFESVEEDEKPVLVGATPEKLVLFLTQISTPGLKSEGISCGVWFDVVDTATFATLRHCYSYFITPEALLELFFLRFELSMSHGIARKEQRKVEEIVRTRVLGGVERMMAWYNEDRVQFSPLFSDRLAEFITAAGFAPSKGILCLAAENKSISLAQIDLPEPEFSREKRKVAERELKEARKVFKDARRRIEKDKKRFQRLQRKRDAKSDQRAVKMGLGLSHSSEERHLLMFSPVEVALQLALIDSEAFEAIPWHDFLHQSWAKRPDTSGVTQCIEQFNSICNWVITWIVKQHDIKTRLRTLQHLLDIAEELLNLGDFSAAFAMASALSGASISRLKDTLSLVEDRRKAVMETLERMVDNSGNYRTYRDMRAQVINDRGHCVPHLALYTSQLTFMEDGNPTFWYESEDLINLGKFRLITRTLEEIAFMKSIGYKDIIEADAAIRRLILDTPRLSSAEEQYQQSLICEPRKPAMAARSAMTRLKTPTRAGGGDPRRVSLPSKLRRGGSTPATVKAVTPGRVRMSVLDNADTVEAYSPLDSKRETLPGEDSTTEFPTGDYSIDLSGSQTPSGRLTPSNSTPRSPVSSLPPPKKKR